MSTKNDAVEECQRNVLVVCGRKVDYKLGLLWMLLQGCNLFTESSRQGILNKNMIRHGRLDGLRS